MLGALRLQPTYFTKHNLLSQCRNFCQSAILSRSWKKVTRPAARSAAAGRPGSQLYAGRPNAQHVRQRLITELKRWPTNRLTIDRFRALGLNEGLLDNLSDFAKAAKDELESDGPLNEDQWDLNLVETNSERGRSFALDTALTSRFVDWAADRLAGSEAEQLRQLREAVDFRQYAWQFHRTRARKRKIIMHVGPTNSGKTYNALRALVAARTGFYAGPLRLLAHEVFDRINSGVIRPAPSPEAPDAEVEPRSCNLLTGDDVRIVALEAGLVSCTVEMLQVARQYDVGVIDEVQMIGDNYRGSAWTSAILAANCTELHLCGEESAVPLIKMLLAETADEIVVNKYERLAPLLISKESLRGNWKNIRKGDCVIAFSRHGIFTLKRQIEKETGLRCAVAYGALPPETRVEQATLFNDPGSPYDVMVASDAIGLGLNLKIKRIIFETVTKFDGEKDVQLSVSQVKQIGGRAGRYDHGAATVEPGLVTTFLPADLPYVTKALTQPMTPPSLRAVIGINQELAAEVLQYIPQQTSMYALTDIIATCGRFGKLYCLQRLNLPEAVDKVTERLTGGERATIIDAPVGRDPLCMEAFGHFISYYAQGLEVNLLECLEKVGLMEGLLAAKELHTGLEKSTFDSPPPQALEKHLKVLETLHRVAALYSWLGFRLPASFLMMEDATRIRLEARTLLQAFLESMNYLKKKGSAPTGMTTTAAAAAAQNKEGLVSYTVLPQEAEDKTVFATSITNLFPTPDILTRQQLAAGKPNLTESLAPLQSPASNSRTL